MMEENSFFSRGPRCLRSSGEPQPCTSSRATDGSPRQGSSSRQLVASLSDSARALCNNPPLLLSHDTPRCRTRRSGSGGPRPEGLAHVTRDIRREFDAEAEDASQRDNEVGEPAVPPAQAPRAPQLEGTADRPSVSQGFSVLTS